eukprot:CAMPEP_0198264468 /NCGR_PEP_ID=MMETSP1447-20131203/16039_1 /TAXON_ID=420782 /ORGANISM="Chaetoceros dichaeta, Strain CCMP1751" /LENGTH=231 /DNA_ID=CAMNT_0043953425 /DNA_START=47 /DNA_END=742 /DNA_ORIENTATION=-
MSAVPSLIFRILQVVLLYIVINPAKAGEIHVCARSAENGNHVIPGANIVCRDDDRWSDDDWMASGITESNGCAELYYETKSSWWCRGWDGCWANPDIKCEVSGTCLQPINTVTKNNFNQGNTAHFMVNVEANPDFCNDSVTWDGCGLEIMPDFLTDIADEISGFQEQCNTHDVCLGNCLKSRHTCDQEFINEMHAECGDDDDHYGGDALCQFLATLYGIAVTQFGGLFYNC